MLKSLASVGGYTLLSRLTGFLRDVAMAAVMGAGPMMDAFATAFRLPNHFRAIFGEGAFSAAFVPAYARVDVQGGPARARLFQGRVLTLLFVCTSILTLVALFFTPQVIDLIAPGFDRTPARYALSIELTRITFPYLALITLATLWSGVLNAHERFAAAAAAPILLNLCMLGAMGVHAMFPSAAHAAAWAVLLSGLLQAALVAWAAARAGILAAPATPKLDEDLCRFFRSFLPAVIGSAGTQIAMFADTIIASLLPTGAPSAIYYADRLYQLPIGVIAVAAGTVLLPEMSRRVAGGDDAGAHRVQNRLIGLTALMTLPFVVAFAVFPSEIVGVLFGRGRFDADAVRGAGGVLAAYGIGLPAAVLIRSAVASFQSRGDTRTPMLIALFAVGVNVALKVTFTGTLGAAGLAAATSAGAWINLILLVFFACRSRLMAPDDRLVRQLVVGVAAALALAVAAVLLDAPLRGVTATLPRFQGEAHLALIGTLGAVLYGALVLVGTKLAGAPLARR